MLSYWFRESIPPTLLILFDNSSSISAGSDSVRLSEQLNLIESLKNEANGKYEVQYNTLDGRTLESINDLTFQQSSTNLNSAIRKTEQFNEGKNISALIVVSDGIVTEGNSPTFYRYSHPIYTVGLGDTTVRMDLSIKDLYFNKISYQGNQFPVQVDIKNQGFMGQKSRVILKHNGSILESKTVSFSNASDIQKVDFLVSAEQKGTQRYQISIEPLEGEYNLTNNTRDLFVEIVEGKEKILLISKKPHPDIKAIRSAIETNENYSFDIFIAGIGSFPTTKEPYDLIIYHQILPNDPLVESLNIPGQKTTASWYFFQSGQQGQLAINDIPVSVNPVPGEFDLSTPVFNTAFPYFQLSDDLSSFLRNLPPVSIPFGNYILPANASPLLFQRVGSIETTKPLLVISSDEPKKGVMLGEGLWKWRLQDYRQHQNHILFNELISKTVQYLSTKTDKRKLRVYPVSSVFSQGEITFDTEIYNDLYERQYNIPIELVLENEAGEKTSYSFTPTEGYNRIYINNLPQGIYQFVASATLSDKKEQITGQFVVENQPIELVDLQANHSMLRLLASKNGGAFVSGDNVSNLKDQFLNQVPPSRLEAQELQEPFLNLPWVLIVILIFASTEWFLRKYHGGY